MAIFAVYDTATGVITQIRTSISTNIIVGTGEDYVSVDSNVNDVDYLIDLNTLLPIAKTAYPVSTALSAQVNTALSIQNIPNGRVYSTFKEDGDVDVEVTYIDINDGTLDFTTDLAGVYTLVFTSPLYLATTAVITVTD